MRDHLRIIEKTSGFTLLELLVSIALMLIIALLAIPSWQHLSSTIRGIVATNLLESALNRARTEAVARNRVVRICASSNGISCSSQKNWESGWMIYEDVVQETERIENDPVIWRQYALQGVRIAGNGVHRTIKFHSNGRVGTNQSFSVCTVSDFIQRARISIINSGRIRIDRQNQPCTGL